MKINKRTKQIFKESYSRCQVNFINDLTSWGEAQINVLDETQLESLKDPAKFRTILNTDDEIRDFAKEAFLYAVKRYYDHYYSGEAAVQSVKDMLRND